LPPGGQQRQHALQFVGKAQVQQPVGFVQHQVRHGRQAQRVVVHQVQQAPRRGHHNVGTAAQAQHLRVDGYAAKHDGDLERLLQVLRQAAQHFAHLRGQFTVGTSTRARTRRGPPVALSCSCCSKGSAKAAVLPDPVCAAPSRSTPCRMAGMAPA